MLSDSGACTVWASVSAKEGQTVASIAAPSSTIDESTSTKMAPLYVAWHNSLLGILKTLGARGH